MDTARAAVRELRPPLPDLARVGRDGLVQLAFERRGDATVLVRRRFRTPLQFLEPIALEDGVALVVLLNPTGGLLGGDRLLTEIELGPGTHVCVTTPSATRVHRSAGAPAIQEIRIVVGPGATLELVPDHVIPHAGSRLEQSLHVDVAPTGRAILWDAFALGRLARAESWAFERLQSQVEVTSAGRRLFFDRLELEKGRGPLAGRGGAEDAGYVGMLVVAAPARPASSGWEKLADELHEVLGQPSWRGGASPLAAHGCFARCLATSAPDLLDITSALWSTARRSVLGRGELNLRKP